MVSGCHIWLVGGCRETGIFRRDLAILPSFLFLQSRQSQCFRVSEHDASYGGARLRDSTEFAQSSICVLWRVSNSFENNFGRIWACGRHLCFAVGANIDDLKLIPSQFELRTLGLISRDGSIFSSLPIIFKRSPGASALNLLSSFSTQTLLC
jgi:hypothetical protein